MLYCTYGSGEHCIADLWLNLHSCYIFGGHVGGFGLGPIKIGTWKRCSGRKVAICCQSFAFSKGPKLPGLGMVMEGTKHLLGGPKVSVSAYLSASCSVW